MEHKPLRHVIVVIDQSWSMEKYKKKLVASFNRMIDKIRTDPFVVTLAMFNEKLHYLCRETPVANVGTINESDMLFQGCTAFYDIMGELFTDFSQTMNTPTTLFIVTDGEDNSSVKYKRSDIDGMCQRVELFLWTIVHCDTEGSKLHIANKVKFDENNIDNLFAGLTI